MTVTSLQYGVPVIKYDRKGFKTRQRQLILTQKAAYVVELAKIKQKIEYSMLQGKKQAPLTILWVDLAPGPGLHLSFWREGPAFKSTMVTITRVLTEGKSLGWGPPRVPLVSVFMSSGPVPGL